MNQMGKGMETGSIDWLRGLKARQATAKSNDQVRADSLVWWFARITKLFRDMRHPLPADVNPLHIRRVGSCNIRGRCCLALLKPTPFGFSGMRWLLLKMEFGDSGDM